MVKWNAKNKETKEEEVEVIDPQTSELEQPEQDEQVEEQVQMGYDDAIKIVSRDLVKAGTDLAVGYDKKLSEVLQSVADKVTEITG